ncbi:hypothetical protein DEO72_LG2g4232 [Vigna unguiculata]|uniref:Uncharacterized protein n=1 Tax=Vigna unguiculata TaxID=3917 RepID=A0A4D6L626_VIGUN|nr:hypothetical protein DEO72_LG2g4232 [Vigna unguiculata]
MLANKVVTPGRAPQFHCSLRSWHEGTKDEIKTLVEIKVELKISNEKGTKDKGLELYLHGGKMLNKLRGSTLCEFGKGRSLCPSRAF